ncbi:MAG: hypothetical protein ACLU4N_12190 [Butyricimonas faecihominis]
MNVTLVKGSVAVRSNNDQANTSEVVLNPGEMPHGREDGSGCRNS